MARKKKIAAKGPLNRDAAKAEFARAGYDNPTSLVWLTQTDEGVSFIVRRAIAIDPAWRSGVLACEQDVRDLARKLGG